jgi:hypothetical protein
VLVDVVVPGKLGGSQRSRQNMEQSIKTGSQQDQMEEFHGCPMLHKELQELRRRRRRCSQLFIRYLEVKFVHYIF